MFSIIGIVVVFGCVVAGYLMEHGNLKVLMQPAELIIILGAAIGTVLIANPLYILTKIGSGIGGAFGGSPFNKQRYPDPEKAYLAGLLHDIGVLVNCTVAPEEFRASMEKAMREQIPLDEAEKATLGFTHSDTGRILAEAWKIPADIADAIELHHQIGDPERGGPLVALVHLSDLLCRMRDLGYGYYEPRQIDFANEPGWLYLIMKYPSMAEIDLARFTFSLDEYAKEVSDLVATVFAG
jgi:chemotaxis protein MotA